MQRFVNTWFKLAAQDFYELREDNIGTILLTFDAMVADMAESEDLDIAKEIQLVSLCCKGISIPKYSDRFYTRLLSNTIAQDSCASLLNVSMRPDTSEADSEVGNRLTVSSTQPHADSQQLADEYVSLINSLLPYLASESVRVAALSLSFIPAIACNITQDQLLDTITNVTNALEVYTSLGDTALLPALSAAICLSSLVLDSIEANGTLHAGTLLAVKHLLSALKHSATLHVYLVDDAQGSNGLKLTHFDIAFYQRLLGMILSRIMRSQQLTLLCKIEDVDLIVSIVSEVHSLLRCFVPFPRSDAPISERYSARRLDELAVVTLLHMCRERNFLESLLRTPNYLSAFLSHVGSILIATDQRSTRIGNATRGFLTACLLTDTFLSRGEVQETDVEAVLSTLRMDLKGNKQNIESFKDVVSTCYDNYLSNFGIPLRAARPLRLVDSI